MTAGLAMVLAGVLGACVGLWLAIRARTRVTLIQRARAQEIGRIRATAEREALTLRRQVEVAAREEALVSRSEAEPGLRRRQVELAEMETALAGRAVFLNEEARAVEELRTDLSDREAPLKDLEREKRASDAEVVKLASERRNALELAAKASAAQVVQGLVELEIEEARGLAQEAVRNASEGGSSTDVSRGAKRLMGISGGRMSERFYSERAQSIIALPENRGPHAGLTDDDLKTVEGISGVTLAFTDEGEGIRLEGLDGVGRELARRCIGRMLRKPGLRGDALAKAAREITVELDREIVERGQRGFAMLKLERAHPDIVKLVGRLNFRTSYSQNQWEHAVEAGFLCGMMAAELGLDIKVARRAALLHDIGKALTHELDGSHALIGADYARRLGETEIVANAIGAHHTDEPFGSPYAHLVAAADAMSGGRPGSRRQSDDNHMAKLAEIERIARGFRGVGEAFAVQGGREVRVYVEEDRIDDAAAVKLASDIAQAISREMTFPGQIKVTVIREFNAVEMAS
jgi:ribonucrease Y